MKNCFYPQTSKTDDEKNVWRWKQKQNQNVDRVSNKWIKLVGTLRGPWCTQTPCRFPGCWSLSPWRLPLCPAGGDKLLNSQTSVLLQWGEKSVFLMIQRGKTWNRRPTSFLSSSSALFLFTCLLYQLQKPHNDWKHKTLFKPQWEYRCVLFVVPLKQTTSCWQLKLTAKNKHKAPPRILRLRSSGPITGFNNPAFIFYKINKMQKCWKHLSVGPLTHTAPGFQISSLWHSYLECSLPHCKHTVSKKRKQKNWKPAETYLLSGHRNKSN